MTKFKYTFWFYAKEHFKKKSLIMFGIFFAVTIGILFAIDHFGGGSYADIAIVQGSDTFIVPEELFEVLEERNFYFVASYDVAREMLDEGEVSDVFLIEGIHRPELTIISSNLRADTEVQTVLTGMLTAFHIEGISAHYELPLEAVVELTTPIMVNFEFADLEDLMAVEIINMIVPVAIYILVLLSGQMVANSVSAEKTSRVMEVMLGKVHPTITMISKVLATFLGIILPLIAILLGVVGAVILGIVDLSMILEVVSEFITIEILILSIIVFFLGYFCFIFLFTSAGAIANSVESLTTTLNPIIYMTVIPFLLPIFFELDSAIMNILVYVPFVSPFVLIQRFLMGYSSLIEVGIAIVLMLSFSILTLIISARLYRNGISHTREEIKFKDLKMLLQK